MAYNQAWKISMVLLLSLIASNAISLNAGSEIFDKLGGRTSQNTFIVTSTADSGAGTLRQALADAQSGDIITFDPAVFPPNAPVTIYLTTIIPGINQGNLAIDASNAGVILDGSKISGSHTNGLEVMSSGNTIQGLQISNFSEAGIAITGGAQYNTIGGDRRKGSGPFGQGNLISNNLNGVRIADAKTSFNSIRGNLMGTDSINREGLGNEGMGVSISHGANRNTIGPNNIIARNSETGISVVHTGTTGNTITQNRIYDNGWQGICLDDGGNTELTTPLITDFDLSGGTIVGTTCANCVVEVFSDEGDEGEVYEGSTVADGLGVFTFNKGAPFTGPHLTATATDADGNTSEFSAPTSGTEQHWIIQTGNSAPKNQLSHKESKELEDNRMGDMYCLGLHVFNEEPDDFVDRINKKGLKWMQVSLDAFDFSDVAKGLIGYSKYEIDPLQERAISGLVNNGIKVMYMLNFWDESIELNEGYARFKKEDEIQRYLDYARWIVQNFKNTVEYYILTNEPNYGEHSPPSQQNIEVSDYINLVRRTIPVIRQEYPEAKIVVGATGLGDENWQAYLFEILESDVMPLVDAIAWHTGPKYGPGYEETDDYYYNYPSIVQNIKDTASAHGFTGEYLASEMTFWTPDDLECDPCYPWTYPERLGAKYLGRGIIKHLGMNLTTGCADRGQPTQEKVITNLCTLMAGAEPASLPLEIQSEATNMNVYGFSLSNGDHLIAYFRDDYAVENDAGVEATLKFQGESDLKLVGIDILNGFEQEMITSNEQGSLVIRDLLVKDYPIILRFVTESDCGPEQAVPNEHIVEVCDAACQQGAPVKAGSQALDVCMNYSGPVTALVGIMTQDFSTAQWLRADDCSFSDNFQIAMDGSQYLACSNVQFSEAFRQGWVFWLVSPVSLDQIDWQSGDYELLFNQIPKGVPTRRGPNPGHMRKLQ